MKTCVLFLTLILCIPSMIWAEEPAPASVVEKVEIDKKDSAELVSEKKEEEKSLFVEKSIELSGIVKDGKLREAIGIETLADIVTAIIPAGQEISVPLKLKLGVTAECECARLRLFRIPEGEGKKPIQILDNAIQGYALSSKTAEVILEVSKDSQLHLKASLPADFEKEKSLTWISIEDLEKNLKAKKEVVVVSPAETASKEIKTEVSKTEPSVK